MNHQLQQNWKKAQELNSQKIQIDADLQKLQDELRFLSDAVNKKVQAKEMVLRDIKKIQEETKELVESGQWLLKEIPQPVEERVTASKVDTSANKSWQVIFTEFVIATFKGFLAKLSNKNQSAPVVSGPGSSTVAPSSPQVKTA